MIVFRAGQGFTGGVLIPMSFTIVLTTLPPSKQPIGLAMFCADGDLCTFDWTHDRRLAD